MYHLLLHIEEPRRLSVGSLGRKDFLPGYYVYTGSAKRGLASRLERHLRRRKKKHWHIDYLTGVARIEQIIIDDSGDKTECQRHQAIKNLHGAQVTVPGFGSSDCRCRSHLAYFERRLTQHFL